MAEALRLGAGWQVSRLCHERFALRLLELRPGDWLLASPYHIHRDPRWWPDPEAFRPERWNGQEPARRPKYAYLPFGVSSRVCMGRDPIVVLMLSTLVTLVRRWRLEPVVREPVAWRSSPHGDFRPASPLPAVLGPAVSRVA